MQYVFLLNWKAGKRQHFAVIFLKALVVFARPTVASERHPSNDLLPQVYAGQDPFSASCLIMKASPKTA